MNPVTHAQRLARAHSIKDAIKIAKGSLFILGSSTQDAGSYKAEEVTKLRVFWRNVVSYLEGRHGSKVEFSDAVLRQFHYTRGR